MFSPVQLGQLKLSHRVVLAPLTRQRSPETLPGPLLAEYYQQRASQGGLLITEATCVSLQGTGALHVPGIWNDEQVKRWQVVTKAVHDKGGLIVCQLWHMGRVSHISLHGIQPVGPSPITFKGKTMSPSRELVDYEIPHELDLAGIKDVVKQYASAAQNAIKAGFDGVEVHGANGYLIDQFLNDCSNLRKDDYGGSIENRARFLLQVVDAVVAAVGSPSLVGLRLSPAYKSQGMGDSNPVATWSHVLEQLNPRNLAYVHIVEPRTNGFTDNLTTEEYRHIWRNMYKGKIITAGGYTRDEGNAVIEKGLADAVAFGRHFISNPDLPHRLEHNLGLNAYDRKTFYRGGPKGYIDYPFLSKL